MGEATFGFTGGPQLWSVPVGVSAVFAILAGPLAQEIVCTFPVTPGEPIQVNVGGPPNHFFGVGGWNGGADGPVAPGLTPSPDFPLGLVSAASSGSTDIRRDGTSATRRVLVAPGRGGVAWSVVDGVASTLAGDAGDIDPALGYTILGPQPGPTDPPRAPRVGPIPDYTLSTSGTAGGATDGAVGYLYDADHAAGAGGGGFGGGGSGSVYEYSGVTPPDDLILNLGGNTGGWFAADGYTAIGGIQNNTTEGYVIFRWEGADQRGWSVGQIRF